MRLNYLHREFLERLGVFSSAQDKADVARRYFRDQGFLDFFYVFAFAPEDVGRGTALALSSFPDEVFQIYCDEGAAANDPVAERIAVIDAPEIMDNVAIMKTPKYKDHLLGDYFLSHDHDLGVTVPIKQKGGMGAVTVFADGATRRARLELVRRGLAGDVVALSGLFHESLINDGVMKSLLSITDKERDALAFLADGFRVDDISERLKISERAVEQRLQRIRKKLGAANTANAVYRAAVNGII